jgi:hypothetical protein
MRVDDTEINPGRIRLIQVVATTFVLDGVISLVLVFLRLFHSGFSGLIPLGWIVDIIIGLGLLRFSQVAYIASRWWISVKLALYVARLIWLLKLGIMISQLHDSHSSIWALFEKAMTPALVVIAGFIALAIWQLWVLNRRYTRAVFGREIVGPEPTRLVQRRLP